MAGRRMLTADVLAFTTKVDRHVATRTPPAAAPVPAPVTTEPSAPVGELACAIVGLLPPGAIPSFHPNLGSATRARVTRGGWLSWWTVPRVWCHVRGRRRGIRAARRSG